MRSILALLLVTLSIGCADDTPPACEGLRCQVVDCAKTGRPETSISGTAFAPNGTLPLFGVTAYVPNGDPGALPDGAQCSRCTDPLPGDPIAQTLSDPAGKFTLTGVPSGENIPLVITIGKWRRQITIPAVAECSDTPLAPADTSLPKTKLEGDLPKIAIVTGNCDALECLVRKLGVADAELTSDTGDGRVHLFASNGANRTAANQASAFAPASALWGSVDKLKQYDLAMFSCECSQQPAGKPQAAMDALKAYADLGGRVFLSHYHSIWISGENGNPAHAPPVWPAIASCNIDTKPSGIGVIDQLSNPRGAAFAAWMAGVGGGSTAGELSIVEPGQTCSSLDTTRAERWVYLQSGANEILQNFQFTTPNELAKEGRCGKVVFSDMHVASGSTSSSTVPFPNGCSTTPMTPQEQALAFMFFDIASCVGPIF
jgi:hypothetical protein